MSKLEVKNIVAGYSKDVDVLHDISLTVDDNCVALIGANGAGKSSTLKTISKILPLKRGRILFDGEDLGKLKPHQIVQKGIIQIPEEGGTFPNLTIYENLAVSCTGEESRKNLKKNMDVVYTFFPVLKEREKLMAGTLSGGQRKMLSIGKAIMAEPKLLLLDDISMGLAPKVVEDLYMMLGQLVSSLKIPVLIVEQIVDIALDFAEYAHVLAQGRIILSGASKDLLKSDEVQKIYIGG